MNRLQRLLLVRGGTGFVVGLAIAVAAAAERDEGFPVPPVGFGSVRTAAERQVRAALEIVCREDREPLPPAAWARHLETALGVPVLFDPDDLAAADLGPPAAIRLPLPPRGMRYGEGLSEVLAPLELDLLPADGVLRIVPRAEVPAVGGLYDVRELVRFVDPDGEETLAVGNLPDAVAENCGARDEWSDYGGGSASFVYLGGGLEVLSVKASYRAHRDLETLLAALRLSAAAPIGQAAAPAVGWGTIRSKSALRLRNALAECPREAWGELPLRTWIARVETRFGVLVAATDLADAGLTLDSPIRFAAGEATWFAALDRGLSDLGLALVPGDGTLRITVRDGRANVLGRYPIEDLFAEGTTPRIDEAFRKRYGVHWAEPEPGWGTELLTHLLRDRCNLPPEPDDSAAPPAVRLAWAGTAALVILNAPPAAHVEAEALLAELRSLPVAPPAETQAEPLSPEEVADANAPSADPAPVLPEDERRTAAIGAINRLGYDLFRRAVAGRKAPGADPSGNVAVAPFAVANALGVFVPEARGETAKLLSRRLHPDLSAENFVSGMQAVRASLPLDRGWERCRVASAGRLWLGKDVTAAPAYAVAVRERFGFDLVPTDFSRPDEAAGRINAWIERETLGLIRGEIVQPSGFAANPRLFLTAALALDARWQHRFPANATRPGEFRSFGPRSEQVLLMSQETKFLYAEPPDAAWLRLPYGRGTLEMWAILPPREPAAFVRVAASLSDERFASVAAAAKRRTVLVTFPKVKLDMRLQLDGPLRHLGFGPLFDDTKPLETAALTAAEPLFLRDPKQFARLEIDEEGTRAAAVVMLGGFGAAAGGPNLPPIEFRVDRPFLFLIRDARTGLVLFLGAVEHPSAAD